MEKEKVLGEDNTYLIKDILIKVEVINKLLRKNVPIVARTKLIRLLKEAKQEVEIYHQARIELAKQYSGGKEKITKTLNEKGIEQEFYTYDIPKDKQEQFDLEVINLQEQKVVINFTKIPIEDFDKCAENIGGYLAIIIDLLIIK